MSSITSDLRGLNDATPGSVYQPSSVLLPRNPIEFIYQHGFILRKVNNSDDITWHKGRVFVSEVFRFEVLGFEQVDQDFYKVYFRNVEIGEFDAEALRFRPVQVLRWVEARSQFPTSRFFVHMDHSGLSVSRPGFGKWFFRDLTGDGFPTSDLEIVCTLKMRRLVSGGINAWPEKARTWSRERWKFSSPKTLALEPMHSYSIALQISDGVFRVNPRVPCPNRKPPCGRLMICAPFSQTPSQHGFTTRVRRGKLCGFSVITFGLGSRRPRGTGRPCGSLVNATLFLRALPLMYFRSAAPRGI